MLRMREGCQQAADLGGGHGDEVAYVVAAMVIMPQACRESCPRPLMPPLSCAYLRKAGASMDSVACRYQAS
jgi:hypothetical protein